MKIDINHPDFNLGLDTTFNDTKLETDYLKYALTKHSSVNSHTQTNELLCKLREDNTTASAPQKFVFQEDFGHERLGTVLSWKEFLRKLNRIIPARYAGQLAGKLINLQVKIPTDKGGEWKFACGAQPGIVPEFSTMYFNAYGVPTSEMYRGWRTVLLRLITENFITEEQADKEFGIVPSGPDGRHYRQLLHSYRNRNA